MSSFFVWKLFCTNSLCYYCIGKSKLAKMLLMKYWRNWPHVVVKCDVKGIACARRAHLRFLSEIWNNSNPFPFCVCWAKITKLTFKLVFITWRDISRSTANMNENLKTKYRSQFRWFYFWAESGKYVDIWIKILLTFKRNYSKNTWLFFIVDHLLASSKFKGVWFLAYT